MGVSPFWGAAGRGGVVTWSGVTSSASHSGVPPRAVGTMKVTLMGSPRWPKIFTCRGEGDGGDGTPPQPPPGGTGGHRARD